MEYKVIEVIKKSTPFTPVVKIIDYRGRKAVLKDYSECPGLTRTVWGNTLIGNEVAVMKHLRGISGIPVLIDRTDSGLITEYIQGEPLGRFKEKLPYEIIPRIEALISAIHAKGVVHLDLAQKRNILVGPDMKPYLIDFANALYFRRRAFGFKQIFNYLCLIDRASLLKFKNRYFPAKMTNEDKKFMKWFWRVRRLWIFSRKNYRPSDDIK
ncbi:MAG: RIO1 family regulatory kinase/ATPase [Candidatus Brocadiia bacterium]